MPGGSSSMVYSRTKRPDAQFSSTSISMKGSLTGRLEVTFSTALPLGFFSTAKRSEDKNRRVIYTCITECLVRSKIGGQAVEFCLVSGKQLDFGCQRLTQRRSDRQLAQPGGMRQQGRGNQASGHQLGREALQFHPVSP